MGSPKTDLITFKVEHSLAELIDRLPNKSEFIRNALLGALANTCPLCQGTGVLSPNQKTHWNAFAAHHPLRECEDCHEVHLICSQDDSPHQHSAT